MQHPSSRRQRRVMRPGPGTFFLTIGEDLMALIFKLLPGAYGKSKLATVCKTFYNRYSVANSINRVVKLYKKVTDGDCIMSDGACDWKWNFDSDKRMVWTSFKIKDRDYGSKDWVGQDHLNVRVFNVEISSKEKRRPCATRNFFQATEEEKVHARSFRYTQIIERVKCDVKLEEDSLINTWSKSPDLSIWCENSHHHGGHPCNAPTLVTTHLPFLSGKSREEMRMRVRKCSLIADGPHDCVDFTMGEVSHYPTHPQVLSETRLQTKYDIEIEMRGPGFLCNVKGILYLGIDKRPFLSSSRIADRENRDDIATRLYNSYLERRGLAGIFPGGNSHGEENDPETESLGFAEFAHFVKGKVGILGDGIEEYSCDEEEMTSSRVSYEYWKKHIDACKSNPCHSFKSRAIVDWTSIEFVGDPPRTLACVRVNPSSPDRLVDAQLFVDKTGTVKLNTFALHDTSQMDSDSESEDPVSKRRRMTARR